MSEVWALHFENILDQLDGRVSREHLVKSLQWLQLEPDIFRIQRIKRHQRILANKNGKRLDT
jgi:hypothetical protein